MFSIVSCGFCRRWS